MVRGRQNPLHKKLPARLKQARKKRGLSRVALCLAAGLSDMVVAYIEAEERIPTMGTVVKLATALGVSAGWLAYGVTDTAASVSESSCRGAAERLKALRTRLGLSRDALALAAGTTAGPIQHIEDGLGTARVDTVERLAVALDVSPAWLAFGNGEPVPVLVRPLTSAAPRS